MTGHPPTASPEQNKRFDDLFVIHAPVVFRFACRQFRGDRHRANDIVQQVFTAVFEQWQRDFMYKSLILQTQMIMTFAKRRVIDDLRRTERMLPFEEYADTVVPMFTSLTAQRDPQEIALTADDLDRFWNVLEEHLTAAEYRVALMAWDLQMPDKEIASLLGNTISTVQSHKSRARRKIQIVLKSSEHAIEFYPISRQIPEISDRGTASGGGVIA